VITRRQFLKRSVVAAVGLALVGCQEEEGNPNSISASQETLILRPTVSPTSESSHPLPVSKTPIAATTSASPTWVPSRQVATGQSKNYDLKTVKNELLEMLDSLGGIKDILPLGGITVLKVNLTGGVGSYSMGGLPAQETIATHPVVVQALGELLIDAGAGELFIVEAINEWETFQAWGYEEIARTLNARLIDLNSPAPFETFTETKVKDGWMIYDRFTFNRILTECDTFISIAKMKCHIECGVTHSMKNLVGLVPFHEYSSNVGDNWRSAFHGTSAEKKMRLPRVITDLNLARPIHLAVIDGIKTIEAGEGSWAKGVKQLKPGVLVAGKNAVATDAIATAIQGFDPTADYPDSPFFQSVNHLNLATRLGMGTNRIDEIEILGPVVADLLTPFTPANGYK